MITRPKDLWLPRPVPVPCSHQDLCYTLDERTWRTEVMASDSRLFDRYVRTQPASRLQLVVLVLLSLAASTFVQARQGSSIPSLYSDREPFLAAIEKERPKQKSDVKFKAAQAKAKRDGVHTLTQKDIEGLSVAQLKQIRGY